MKIRTIIAGAIAALLLGEGIARAVTRDPVQDAVAVRPATNTPAFPVARTATKMTVQQVLVISSGSGTMVPTTPMTGRVGIEVQNRGPNSIYCKETSGAVVGTSREIASGSTWSLDVTELVAINCKAATADQVTGAATIVTEVGR
jgi:hypothetical protein